MNKLQRLYALSCRGYMLSCRGYIHKLQRLYAGYSDNKYNSTQFQLGLELSLAKVNQKMNMFSEYQSHTNGTGPNKLNVFRPAHNLDY